MSYIDIIKDKARADKKTIVLPETTDKIVAIYSKPSATLICNNSNGIL